MCFSTPKVDNTPASPAPTVANTGDSETTAATNEAQRKKLRAAAGYQQNILTGTSDTGKKSLLG